MHSFMIICSGESLPAMYPPTGVLELYDAWQRIRRWSRHPLHLLGGFLFCFFYPYMVLSEVFNIKTLPGAD